MVVKVIAQFFATPLLSFLRAVVLFELRWQLLSKCFSRRTCLGALCGFQENGCTAWYTLHSRYSICRTTYRRTACTVFHGSTSWNLRQAPSLPSYAVRTPGRAYATGCGASILKGTPGSLSVRMLVSACISLLEYTTRMSRSFCASLNSAAHFWYTA